MRNDQVIKQYQILRVAVNTLEGVSNRPVKGICTYTNRRLSLVYAEPKEIYSVTSQLEEFGIRGVVLPDHVLTRIVKESRDFGFNSTSVEFASKPAFTSLANELIAVGKEEELNSFLEKPGAPITAVSLSTDGVTIKLHGSGLITVSTTEAMLDATLPGDLQQLTDLLMKFLEELETDAQSRIFLEGRRQRQGREQEQSLWGRIIAPVLRG